MGSLAYSPPIGGGGGGTNFWMLNGDGTISPIGGIDGIKVQSGDGVNQLILQTGTYQLNSFGAVNGVSIQLNPNLLELNAANGGASNTDVQISAIEAYISTQDAAGNFGKVDITNALAELRQSQVTGELTFIRAAIADATIAVSDGAGNDALLGMLPNEIASTLLAGLSTVGQLVLDSIGLGYEVAGNNKFVVLAAGEIQTNQLSIGVVPLPVSFAGSMEIEDILGNIHTIPLLT